VCSTSLVTDRRGQLLATALVFAGCPPLTSSGPASRASPWAHGYMAERGVEALYKNFPRLVAFARTRWPWLPDIGLDELPL